LKSRILDKQRHTSRSLGHGGDMNLGGGMPFGAGAREVLARSKHFKGPDAERDAYVSGMWLRAQYGHEGSQRWIASHRPDLQVRAMSAASLAAGGAVVPIEMMQTIIDLKDAFGAFRANATVWPMNSDQLKIPQSKTDTGAAFLGESDTIVETDGVWTNVTLSSKKIGSIVRVPTELFEDSIVSLADRVAFEIARQFAKTEDTAGFAGDGTSTYGGIQGFTSMIIDGNHNAGKIALPSGKNKFTDVTATDLASLIASLPAYAHDNAKFYVSPVGWGNTFFRLMQAVSGNRVDTMAGGVPRQYGGYPVVVTPVLPTSTGSLAAAVMLLFGDLRRGAAFGDRQQIRVQVLMERYADNDQVGIKATERFDIITRHGCGDNTTAGPVVGLIGTA
jgi:HK97 family phage major capsid protein